MTLPYAVVLAGGKGARLGGVRKADIRIGGRKLLDRVTDALGPVSQPLMVSTGRQHMPALPYGVAVPDLTSSVGGPLAGVAAAVAALADRGIGNGILVSVAVDTPFLPSQFSEVMAEACSGVDSVFAAYGEHDYPPNAAWRLEALADLPEQVVRGTAPRSLKALHHVLGGKRLNWIESYEADPFSSLNSVEDLVRLAKRERDGRIG